jgi:hypothetical protein
MRHKSHFLAAFLFSLSLAAVCYPQTPRWSEAKANAWYAKHPWLAGSNYTPATAINELEMWQAETFDPQRIDLEFGWAESLGVNTMRVFLHDLLGQQDAAGFQKRIDTFLGIAEKHHIKILFVLFDSCWDPTYYPWDSWQHPYVDREPAVWFHEVFRADGQPYRPEEVDFIRAILKPSSADKRSDAATPGT